VGTVEHRVERRLGEGRRVIKERTEKSVGL
jgi:hypothetical protein